MKSTDLSQLREAANLTANSILQAYEARSTVRQAYSDLLIAAVSMGASLLFSTMSERVFSIAYGCALLTLGQAAWSTWHYIRRTDRLSDRRAVDMTPDAIEAA